MKRIIYGIILVGLVLVVGGYYVYAQMDAFHPGDRPWVSGTAYDADHDPVVSAEPDTVPLDFEVNWRVNGDSVGTTTVAGEAMGSGHYWFKHQFPDAAATARGDVIVARVRAVDQDGPGAWSLSEDVPVVGWLPTDLLIDISKEEPEFPAQ